MRVSALHRKKHLLAQVLFSMSDLDAKPSVVDLDARLFAKGYTNPLVMMGVALDRYLPGRNAMLVNEAYVTIL